jgi:phage terminase large subunit-like protein
LAFAQEYLCKVVDDESAAYPRNLTRQNLDMENTFQYEKYHQGKYVIGFDPSHGLGQDYSVMVVMRQDENGDLHLVNIWRRNDFPPAKQAGKLVELAKKYGNATISAEVVGFQQMFESLLAQMGAVVDYQESKVSNKVLKQGLLNRLRVWFEQGKIHFAYGDHHTRQMVNILLDELETHVWKAGEIVDLGRHNDCVMALAHAVDKFSHRGEIVAPMAKGVTSLKGWTTGKNNSSGRPNPGRYVGLF